MGTNRFNFFVFITVKSHILRHALKPGCLNFRTVPQLIGTLFFPLLRACHFIRKRGSSGSKNKNIKIYARIIIIKN